MKLVPVLGLEIHLQLNTDHKMFCTCKNDPFYDEQNTNVCPVCLGLPGAMPVPNENAIKSAIKMAKALGSNINHKVIYERKNYFYPDLPKAFQLTCPHDPISTGGEFKFKNSKNEKKVIRWREIHLEEDTAKSAHKEGKTWIDFNKSGVPLLEMVSEPDIESIDEAVEFCKEIQLIARYLGVSNADMEKGNMRLEANISMREEGTTELPDYRVELKNINSFNFMKKAVEAELRRQSEALKKGEELDQETRGYNEDKDVTFTQRSKEEAHDYRYFPEPDIPAITFTDEYIKEITDTIADLPSDVRNKLQELGLKNDQYITKLTNNSDLYEKFIKVHEKLSKETDMKINRIASLVLDTPEFSDSSSDEIVTKTLEKESSKISSGDDLEPIVQSIIEHNPKAVEDYKNGNENSMQFLMGQVMKETKGQADAGIARNIILEKLK